MNSEPKPALDIKSQRSIIGPDRVVELALTLVAATVLFAWWRERAWELRWRP